MEPWALGRGTLLSDDELLHVVALSAYFGHLNRIADAVAVPLDYAVQVMPPPADPTVPAFARAPHPVTGAPKLDLATRGPTHAALAAWHAYVFPDGERSAIAGAVAAWLGDGTTSVPDLDPDLRALAETVTLAPWQLTDASYAALRGQGLDDAALFAICVVASTAGVASRIRVALASL